MNASPDEAHDEEPWADEPTLDPPIEPGSPSAENAAFVLLGVLTSLFALARIAGLV